MKRPPLRLGAGGESVVLLAPPEDAPAADVAALALRAFAGDAAPAAGPLVARPRFREAPRYACDIGVDPAARPRRLGPTEAAEAAGLPITPAAFRDLSLPD